MVDGKPTPDAPNKQNGRDAEIIQFTKLKNPLKETSLDWLLFAQKDSASFNKYEREIHRITVLKKMLIFNRYNLY